MANFVKGWRRKKEYTFCFCYSSVHVTRGYDAIMAESETTFPVDKRKREEKEGGKAEKISCKCMIGIIHHFKILMSNKNIRNICTFEFFVPILNE